MTETAFVNVAMDGRGVLRRRGFLQALGLGAAGMSLGLGGSGLTRLMAAHADDLRDRKMSCILLWMAGGPSQLETFDPKPEHANGGGTKAIDTAVPGIQVAEAWERTAAQMREIALIRSMTNKEGNHQRASYQLHTGYVPTPTVKHPNFGCNIAAELGDPKFDLPQVVSIGGPTAGAGLLGASFEPFVVQDPTKPPQNLAPAVEAKRFGRRLGLLSDLERQGFARSGGGDRVRDHQALYAQTAGMILSPRVKTFDLEDEDPTLRDAYGRTPFGQGCLLARRLVEAGTPFVEVRSNGWDTHENNHDRVGTLAGQVDPGFATLISDLKQRGRLDRTLIVWMGEFGRTPKVNPKAGRDHFPRVFNVALAGGGITGGQVLGASTDDGSAVKDRPVGVNDLLSTICTTLGIDPTRENMSPIGRPIKVVDGGTPISELLG